MSEIHHKDRNIEKMLKENTIKRIRNKNSYMDAFLERRKQAANFAMERRNTSGCKYTKPIYYINEGNTLLKKSKHKKHSLNDMDNKKDFYKRYNNLKKNLAGKNHAINNIIVIEKENNKYYLSHECPRNYSSYKGTQYQCCEHCSHKSNQYEITDKDNYEYCEYINNNINNNDEHMTNEEINKKYNNIKHHTINLSTKNKNKSDDMKIQSQNILLSKSHNNGFGNNLQIEKAGTNNYYFYDKDKNILSSPSSNSNTNQKYESDYKYKSAQNINNTNINRFSANSTNNKEINKLNENNKNDYYKGKDNHIYYESSCNKYNNNTYKTGDKYFKNINYDSYKYYTNNLSEPKNIDKNRKAYMLQAYKNNNDSDYTKKLKIGNNQINDISPIRTYCRYDFEDNNDDFQNMEKINDSQSLNGNSVNNSNIKFKYNIKNKNNIINNNINNNNGQYENRNRTKSVDMQIIHSAQVIKDTPNTKSVSIVYKSVNNPNKNIKSININNNYDINVKNEEKMNHRNEIIEIINDDKHINNLKDVNNKNTLKSINKDNKKNNNNKNEIIINNNEIKNEKDNENTNKLKNAMNKININNINNNIIINEQKEVKKDEALNTNKKKDDFNNNENDIERDNNTVTNPQNNIRKINNDTNKNKNELKDINKNNEYAKIVDQEQNYETIKEKYESFLKQKDEKEPNFQSKLLNSMFTSKEESNLMASNNNLIKNIKEKIQILKNNNKYSKEHINYNTEIDDYFIKIKQKEEKNNLVLNDLYQDLLKKEKDNINNKNININNNDIIDSKYNIDTNENNKNKSKDNNKNENKKVIIQKSNRLQHMMKNILNKKRCHNYEYNNYYTASNKIKEFKPKNAKIENEEYKELTLKNNFNNIKFSKYNNAPDINLIVDESADKYIKIIDENEYIKLKRKNVKSSRPINLMTKKIKDSNQRMSNFRDRLDIFGFYKFGTENCNVNNKFGEKIKNSFSPRVMLYENKNKIMPPNEI